MPTRVVSGGRREQESLGVPGGDAKAPARSRSLPRSRAGLVGGMSAALMASSPFVVLKVPRDRPSDRRTQPVETVQEPRLSFLYGLDAIRRRTLVKTRDK
jgi:hypothetical protein